MAESHHVSILERVISADPGRTVRQRCLNAPGATNWWSIIAIAICATICGADSWVHVDLFGRSKLVGSRAFWAARGDSLP